MKKYFDILRKCPLFSDVEDGHIEKMLGCLGARVSFFDKKYTVFTEGSRARHLGILLSGEVQITRTDYFGNRNIIANIAPGEIFCEEFACVGADAIPVSAVANEPCEVMLIDCSHILYTCAHNCSHHQKMIFNLMKNMAQKNIRFHERIEVTSKRSTREKLMAYLTLCARHAGAREFEIPFDRQELADYLEVERSGLSAEIGKMKRDGLIDCQKNRFTLL